MNLAWIVKLIMLAEADRLVKLSARLYVDGLNMLFFLKSLYSFKILDDNKLKNSCKKMARLINLNTNSLVEETNHDR